jgi:polyisoprenoid-binding protein YceI
MTIFRYLQLALCTALLTVACNAVASEPCAPFEGGRVDAKILKVMRDAAYEGRLYRVVPGASRVGFCIRHFPFQELRGEFTNIVGGLALPTDIDEHGQALLLIHTSTMESSNPDLTPLVQSHEFMDTKRYPEILFVGRAFEWLGPQHGYIYGDMTLHGKTQPVVFNISVDVFDDPDDPSYFDDDRPARIHLSGTSQVNRLEFDMRAHQFTISQTVRLCLSVDLVPWEP